MPLKTQAALFSSASIKWGTPRAIFAALDAEFHFTLDAAADDLNHCCDNYYTELTDGLAHRWHGVVWLNPPYGRTIGQWMKKAYEEAQQGATVVCLIPARTCTSWWHDYVMKAEIRFIRGRLRFNDTKTSAPFPSVVVVFKGV